MLLWYNSAMPSKPPQRAKKLPKLGTAARRVIDRWIKQDGFIRVYEAADAYNAGGRNDIVHTATTSGRRYYPAALSGILKRYGYKAWIHTRTPWVLDFKWLPKEVPIPAAPPLAPEPSVIVAEASRCGIPIDVLETPSPPASPEAGTTVTPSKPSKKTRELPMPGTPARAVVDKWIALGGMIRVYEAADAYNTMSGWCPGATERYPRWYSPRLVRILKRYGTKPANERRKHTPWVLNEQWLPKKENDPSECKTAALLDAARLHGIPVGVLPPLELNSPLSSQATMVQALKGTSFGGQRTYTFEATITVVAPGRSYEPTRDRVIADLGFMLATMGVQVKSLEPIKIE